MRGGPAACSSRGTAAADTAAADAADVADVAMVGEAEAAEAAEEGGAAVGAAAAVGVLAPVRAPLAAAKGLAVSGRRTVVTSTT